MVDEDIKEAVVKEEVSDEAEKKSEVWTKRSEEQKELVSQLQEKVLHAEHRKPDATL